MATEYSIGIEAASQPSLAALAEQLREGPLQQLIELEAEIVELTQRVEDGPSDQVDDVGRLVRLSVAAMEQFNAFARELAAMVRELTDARRNRH